MGRQLTRVLGGGDLSGWFDARSNSLMSGRLTLAESRVDSNMSGEGEPSITRLRSGRLSELPPAWQPGTIRRLLVASSTCDYVPFDAVNPGMTQVVAPRWRLRQTGGERWHDVDLD